MKKMFSCLKKKNSFERYMNECSREPVCDRTAYESPETTNNKICMDLTKQNADITCIINLFLLLFECHFTSI